MLFVKHLLDHVKDTLGGGAIPGNIDPLGIVNQAGEHLHSMHAWRWAQGRSTLLNLRGTVSGTAAAWTTATNTLTLASAFTDYTFLSGDEIEITDGGSGATEGFVEVASRTSANAVVLSTSISGSNQTGISFTLQPQSIDLPDDVRDIIAIQGTGQTRYGVTLTTLEEVLRVRESVGANDSHWYAAVSYVGSPPTPILEIAPGSGSNALGALRMFYRARWGRISTDTTTIDVPAFMDALLLQVVRAFARGYVREDAGSLSARLEEIHQGPVFRAAVKSDGAIQPHFGTLRNGIERWRRRGEVSDWHELYDRVQGPS
jgi:hypothetical protein